MIAGKKSFILAGIRFCRTRFGMGPLWLRHGAVTSNKRFRRLRLKDAQEGRLRRLFWQLAIAMSDSFEHQGPNMIDAA